MPRIAWDEMYSVNINVIDRQHQHLFKVLGDLYDWLGKEEEKEFLEAIIRELVQYAVEHFTTEEVFMRQYDFPGYEAHKKEHEDFKTKVVSFQEDLIAGKVTLSVEVMVFLTDWLGHHILETDKEYGPFLNKKGVF
ncbi:MAG: bacteriohemerythrin [Candidatus Omnitrophota bacterium]